jgi:hypothetical protein
LKFRSERQFVVYEGQRLPKLSSQIDSEPEDDLVFAGDNAAEVPSGIVDTVVDREAIVDHVSGGDAPWRW